jgi:ATP-dependent Clp protease ATP-binding subunit ClpB
MDFSRFTDISKQTVQKAYRLAREFHCASIEPQIMMVAMMQEGQDMIYFMLRKLNVDKTAFFQAVSDSISHLPQGENDHPDITDNLERVLSKADDLAESTGSAVVALEHIFWAFRCINGPVCEIMKRFGITEQELKNAVELFRNGNFNQSGELESPEEAQKPNLMKYARNLNKEAEEGIIEPSIGRDSEIRRILQIISRKTKNNPILVGEPGTGKTAIVEGLAHRIIRGDIPLELKGIKVYSLDLTALMAGASVQGEFETRLKGLIEEVTSDKDILLFIDEIHLLIGAGRTSGAMDAANILKPAMARGQIKVIGATTTDEFRKYIESDKAFARRFQTIMVEEPDVDSAITILRGIKNRFEKFHRIKILDEAVVAAVHLSYRYINERFLPDKAIDLLDEAASRMRIARSSVPSELDDLSRMIRSKEMERESIRQDNQNQDLSDLNLEIANLREQENVLNAKWQNERRRFEELQQLQELSASLSDKYESAERLGQYDEALRFRNQLSTITEEINQMLSDLDHEDSSLLKASLDEDDIRQVVTLWTGIPVNRMSDDENEKLLHLEDELHASVKGQETAVHVVSNIIRRNRMGFGDANKPIGSFLFLGTTGVGKTELSKALADYLFNSRDMMIRIDMSEYQQEHSVARLFGAPPGYVGYDQGGQLTEAVRRKPYSVILLDEIEKAHRKVFETLLQVLDDGRMTDGQGHVVDFKNTIIIMTSNMGAEDMTNSISQDGSLQNENELKQRIIAMLKQQTSPEFVNRIDEIVMFQPLSKDIILEIVKLQIEQLIQRVKRNDIDLRVSPRAIFLIAEMGYEPTMGARPVKRCINDKVLNPLIQSLLTRQVTKERPINVDIVNGEIQFVND